MANSLADLMADGAFGVWQSFPQPRLSWSIYHEREPFCASKESQHQHGILNARSAIGRHFVVGLGPDDAAQYGYAIGRKGEKE
jgi:hypothetical protein